MDWFLFATATPSVTRDDFPIELIDPVEMGLLALLLFMGPFVCLWQLSISPWRWWQYLYIARYWARPGQDRYPYRDRLSRMLRRWDRVLAIYLATMIGLFVMAALVGGEVASWWTEYPLWRELSANGSWVAAMVLAYPLFISIVRKLRAIAFVYAELRVDDIDARAGTPALRAAVAARILLAGMIVLTYCLLLIRWFLTPPWQTNVLLILFTGFAVFFWWQSFVLFYRRANAVLLEHRRPVLPRWPVPRAASPYKTIELETVALGTRSYFVGQMFRDLHLRRQTGARALGVVRDELNLYNPDPALQLQPNDRLILAGTRSELEDARRVINARCVN